MLKFEVREYSEKKILMFTFIIYHRVCKDHYKSLNYIIVLDVCITFKLLKSSLTPSELISSKITRLLGHLFSGTCFSSDSDIL